MPGPATARRCCLPARRHRMPRWRGFAVPGTGSTASTFSSGTEVQPKPSRATAMPLPKMPSSPAVTVLASRSTSTFMYLSSQWPGACTSIAQHLVGIAAGNEHVRADDLGRIAGADPEQLGRRLIDPAGKRRDGDDDQGEQPFADPQKHPHRLLLPSFRRFGLGFAAIPHANMRSLSSAIYRKSTTMA